MNGGVRDGEDGCAILGDRSHLLKVALILSYVVTSFSYGGVRPRPNAQRQASAAVSVKLNSRE